MIEAFLMNIKNNEYILTWLQNYFSENSFSLPLVVIEDEALKNHRTVSVFREIFIHNNPCLPKLSIIGNPGWDYRYFKIIQKNWYNIEIDQEDDLEDDYTSECYFDWFSTLYRNGEFISASGPQYLSIVLEAFRCFITGVKFNLQENVDDLKRLKAKLDQDNPLLAWLSEFAFKHSVPDIKTGYIILGFYLFAIQEGFVIVIMMEEMELRDYEFEDILIEELDGKIHCYRKGDNIIIRTHFRGLIKGLTIFKDWAEKHRSVWENIDWG